MPRPSDVIIVGGGIIGCSVAYHLAKKGIESTIIERESVGSQASGAATGLLVSLGTVQEPGPLETLSTASCEYHKQLIPEVEELSKIEARYGDFSWLELALSEREERILKRDWGWKLERPEVSWLDMDDLRKFEPRISPNAVSGVLVEGQAQVDPYRLTLAFARAAEFLGCTIKYAEVAGVRSNNGRITGVKTTLGELTADTVVFAMGSWSNQLDQWLGIQVPVKPLKGQTIQLELAEPMPYCMIHNGSNYVAPKRAGVTIAGTFDGMMGYDLTIHPEGQNFILEGLERVCPGVLNAKVVSHITGLRPASADGLPIMGPVPGLEGAYIATGHRRLGITLSAITGQLMSQLILGKETSLSMEPFRLDRFDGKELTYLDELDAIH